MAESYRFGYWGATSEEILKNHFPVHRACRDGDLEALALLLVEHQQAVYTEDSFYGWTPAHWAAYFGKVCILIYTIPLFKSGADVHIWFPIYFYVVLIDPASFKHTPRWRETDTVLIFSLFLVKYDRRLHDIRQY